MKKEAADCKHQFEKWSDKKIKVVRGTVHVHMQYERIYQERTCKTCNLVDLRLVEECRLEDAKETK